MTKVTVIDKESSYYGMEGEVLRTSNDGEIIQVYLPIQQEDHVGGSWCYKPSQLKEI